MAEAIATTDLNETALRRWWAIAGLVLFAATWKLWIPSSEFPQVPLLGAMTSLPPLVDWLSFGVLSATLVLLAAKPKLRRSWQTFAIALSVSLLLDQHRWQPWSWQLLLMALAWGAADVEHVSNVPGLRLSGHVESVPHIVLTISIYFWSALSKLDADFAASHGRTLIEAGVGAVGINAVGWPASWKSTLAFVLPVGELLVAIGLCWPRTRRAALFGATALHIGLLLALGPFGLSHRPGVLLWNLAFIGHDWLLFGRCGGFSQSSPVAPRQESRTSNEFRLIPSTTSPEALGNPVAERQGYAPSLALRVSMAIICLWPAGERWGFCDRWLAWSVYAARSERVSVILTEVGQRRLPESARRCVVDGELPLDRWSLTALDVPTYPQLRFQFGVVEWLRPRVGDDNLVEVVVQHSSGVRLEVKRWPIEQLDERPQKFWVNSQPRFR